MRIKPILMTALLSCSLLAIADELTEGKALSACAKEVIEGSQDQGYTLDIDYFSNSYAIENGGFWSVNLFYDVKKGDFSGSFKAYCEIYTNGNVVVQNITRTK